MNMDPVKDDATIAVPKSARTAPVAPRGTGASRAEAESRGGRTRTLIALLVVQAAMLAAGWMWTLQETRHAVALSVQEKILDQNDSLPGVAGRLMINQPEADLASFTGESMRGVMGLSLSTGLLISTTRKHRPSAASSCKRIDDFEAARFDSAGEIL